MQEIFEVCDRFPQRAVFAERVTPPPRRADLYSSQETFHGRRDFVQMRFQCEVACIQKLNSRVGIISTERFRARGDKIWIMFARYREQGRPPRPEILLERGIKLHVVGVVEKQIQLNLSIAWPRNKRSVQRVIFRRDHTRICDSH
jgi:hypothetical protein